MPKSKNRKPGRKKQTEKGANPRQVAPQKRESWLRRLAKSISNHPAVSLAGVFVIGLAIWEWLAPSFAAPEIVASGSDPSGPFVFPFSVTNESNFFVMHHTQWVCVVSHLSGPIIIMDNVGVSTTETVDIEPEQTQNFRCPVMNAGVPINALSMSVTVKYDTLELWRRSSTQSFTWVVDGSESKWIPGTN